MAEERQCSECGGELPDDAPQGLCPKCLMKLGLPTGADVEKTAPADSQGGVSTNATPPGRFVPPEPAELAKQFPQLEILELLGQGGMGAVYKARQKQLDRLVALKILPPEVGQMEAFAERFTREARSLAKLNHPRIVTVYEFGHTEEDLYYFVMEFVDGTDLRRVIQAGELAPKEALAIVPQVCEALQYAHEEGIVHRDIKPENILLDKKGRVKIADFGLAKLLDRPPTAFTLTAAGHKMGTPHYMAPEQIEHPGHVDHRADIYSLGVVFYEMLTGQLPIGRFDLPSQKVQVDVRLDNVVLKSLEHEPERRYQHASEVKTDVENITAEHMAPGGAPSGPAVVSAKAPPGTLWGIGIQEHLRFVGVLRIVWGALGLLIAMIVLAIFVGPGIATGDYKAFAIITAFAAPIAILITILSVPDIIAGIGLLKRRGWARILVMILAVLDLINIPIGTAIGIYTIWVLMKAKTLHLFASDTTGEEGEKQAESHARQMPLQERFSHAAKGQVEWSQHVSEVKTDVEAVSSTSQVLPAALDGMQVSRMEKHITIVAVLSIVFGMIGVLIGIVAFVAIAGGGLISQDSTAMNITQIVGTAVCGFFMLISVPEVIAGIGLLKRRNWARILALILAVLDLVQVPIGTAIGIYVIWVLLNNETFKLFAQAAEIRKKEQAAGIKPGPRKIVLPIIAITAAVLFLIAVSVTILLGAFPWFAIVFGPPLLIFVVFALWQAKGRAAAGVEGRSSAALPKTDRRAVLIGLVVAGIVIVVTALITLPVLLPAIWLAESRHVSSSQYESLGLPRDGAPGDLTFGPEGPKLNDICVVKLNLESSEANEVNKILQAAYVRYLTLEAQNTQQLRSGNSLKVTISPFRQEAHTFLAQLWAELDSTLDEEQRNLAREYLPLGQLFGKYQFGQAKVVILISKENGTFSHKTKIEWPDRSQESSGSGETLPAELQRFWSEPTTGE